MSLNSRVNRLESEPSRRLVRILRDDEPEGGPSPTVRRAPGGGYEVRHAGQWKSRAELEAEGFELLVIHIVRESPTV
jgi:hypothetical protein